MLTQIKRNKIRQYRFIAFDTEDDSRGKRTGEVGKPILANFYDGNRHTSFWLERGQSEYRRMFEYIYRYMHDKNTLFVAHNLEYDINNIFREVNYCYIQDMIYTSRLMVATLKKHQSRFVDSFNWFAGSLKAMGKVVGLEKLDYEEASEADDDTFLEYCERDTEIVWLFAQKLQERVNKEAKIKMGLTIGRMAMDSLRRNFLPKDYEVFNDMFCRDAYYGGRVECFHIGKIEGNIQVSDVKSMYPTVMCFEYPDCDSLEWDDNLRSRFGIAEVTIDIPLDLYVPPLPVKMNGKLCFPVGVVRGSWTYHEIRHAEKYGCKVLEIHRSIGTDSSVQPFKGYVDYYFDKKENSPKKTFENAFYKLMLNSAYGKLSQHSKKNVVTTELWSPEKLEEELGRLNGTYGPFYLYECEPGPPPDTANWLWGTYVTSYSRIKLHSVLAGVHEAGHKLLYCDTDSVMFLRQNDNIPFSIGNELGQLDEEFFIRGEFITAKGYILENAEGEKKIASKGVPSSFGHEFLTQGSATFQKPTKLREALRQDLQPNLWKEVTKVAQTIYSKREVLEDGFTRPLNANENFFAENQKSFDNSAE